MKLKHIGKSNRSLSLTKNSIVMFLMLVLIVLTTMAWFTYYHTSEALEVYVGSDENKGASITFAMPLSDGSYPTAESAYFTNLNLAEQLKKTSLKDTFTQEVSGNGVNLLIPTLIANDDGSYSVDIDGRWTKATENQDYLSMTFYVRSPLDSLKVAGNSYLDTGSNPLTATLADGTKDKTDLSKLENKSAYGDFSTNGIAGAMRVSLLDVTNLAADTSPTLDNRKFLWIPRPDLLLEGTDGSYTLKKGVESGNSFVYSYYDAYYSAQFADGHGKKLYFRTTPEAKVSKSVVDASNPDAIPVLGTDVTVSRNTGKKVTFNGETYYLYKYTLNMWIEGSDAEASKALNGGQFKLILNFTA